MTDGPLFSEGPLENYLQIRLNAAVAEAGKIAPEEVRFSPHAVADRLIRQYQVLPVELKFSAMTRTAVTEIRVARGLIRTENGFRPKIYQGQGLSLIVPFVGNSRLLICEPRTTCTGERPHATIRDDAVVFSVEDIELTERGVHDQIAAMRKELTRWVVWVNQDVLKWDSLMKNRILQAVRERKNILDRAAELSDALDIPLAPTPEPERVHVPITRKQVRIEQAPPSPERNEPRLANDMYEDVLRTISGMSRAVERLPQTAVHLGEDGFRDLLLFMLNANYEGAARGEVFNAKGKTDILLSWRDRNVFIGECKMWHSLTNVTEAIDQLLGYAAWRDTKAALILFIHKGNPTEIISRAGAAIVKHPSCCSAAPSVDPDLRRDYLMRSVADPDRYIKMAFLPVVIPKITE